jgi:hypothetical protein
VAGKEPAVAGREGETGKGVATDTDKKSFNYATGEIQVSTTRSTSVYSSVSDPDWIRIQNSDPGGEK